MSESLQFNERRLLGRLRALDASRIEVMRRGVVRRAKLYYLRALRGKRARIAEKVERRVGASVLAKAAEIAVAPAESAPEETKQD